MIRKNLNNGTYGYIEKYKKRFGLVSLLWVIFISAIFGAGLLIYKDKLNIFTLFAVLFVLPAARAWTAWIVMLPYHTGNASDYQNALKLLGGKSARVYADMVITKYEGAMYLPIVINYDDNFYAYAPSQKKSTSDIKNYLDEMLKKAGVTTKAQVYDDYKKFELAVKRLSDGAELKGKHTEALEEQLFSTAV